MSDKRMVAACNFSNEIFNIRDKAYDMLVDAVKERQLTSLPHKVYCTPLPPLEDMDEEERYNKGVPVDFFGHIYWTYALSVNDNNELVLYYIKKTISEFETKYEKDTKEIFSNGGLHADDVITLLILTLKEDDNAAN